MAMLLHRMGCQALYQLPVCYDGVAPAPAVLRSEAASAVWTE